MSKGMEKETNLRVGARVTFPYGTQTVEADVIEDRGRIGIGGRQIVRIRLSDDFKESDGVRKSFEMPAEDLRFDAGWLIPHGQLDQTALSIAGVCSCDGGEA